MNRKRQQERIGNAIKAAFEGHAGDGSVGISIPVATLSLRELIEPFRGGAPIKLGEGVTVSIPHNCTWKEPDPGQVHIEFINEPECAYVIKVFGRPALSGEVKIRGFTEHPTHYELTLEPIIGVIPFTVNLTRDFSPPE